MRKLEERLIDDADKAVRSSGIELYFYLVSMEKNHNKNQIRSKLNYFFSFGNF